MKKIFRLIVVSALVATIGNSAVAQNYNEENNLFYHAFRAPQANELNPAFFPASNTFYLTLPGITNFRFGSPIGFNNFLRAEDGITYIDLDKLFATLKENNEFRFGMDMDILGGGLRIHNTFLTANLRMKNNFSIGLPVSTIDFLLNGNVDENGHGRNVDIINGDLFGLQSYFEGSFGIGHRFPLLNLTVGVRAKIYYGFLNVSLENTRITLETDDNFESLTASAYYQVQMAAALPFKLNDEGKPTLGLDRSKGTMAMIKGLISPKQANMGVGFDIGAKYQLGPVAISASILDLSTGLHWHNNIYTLAPSGGVVDTTFSGFEINQLINGGKIQSDSLMDGITKLVEQLKPDSIREGGDYYYAIPTKLNIGASVSLGTMARVGLLFHGQFDRGLLTTKNENDLYNLRNYGIEYDKKNTFRYNTTLTAGVNLFNWLEVIVGSSVVYDGEKVDPLNPGAGFIISPLSAIQTYVMVDYVSSMYLVEAKAFNFKFGFNLLLGGGGRRKML